MSSSIKERFNTLDSQRQGVLLTARKCAELTKPSALPPEGWNPNNPLQQPYQSLGARGINNLTSSLLLTMFPPNDLFFRLSTVGEVPEEDKDKLLEIEKSFEATEKIAFQFLQKRSIRKALVAYFDQLLITGNALGLYRESGFQTFRLDQWVCRKDANGNLLELITKEGYVYSEAPSLIKQYLSMADYAPDDDLGLYTRVTREGEKFKVTQELADGTHLNTAYYGDKQFPYLLTTWNSVNSEDYGRGIVESYYGDLYSLEVLSKSIQEYTAEATKIVRWVSSDVRHSVLKKLVEAQSGDVISGLTPEQTGFLNTDKVLDLQIAQAEVARLTAELKKDFMLPDSIQRNAERVTAEEIRVMRQALETTLGGIYTLLAAQFQEPLIYLILDDLRKEGYMDSAFLKEVGRSIDIHLSTGLDALGRGADYQKLMTFVNSIGVMPDALAYVDVPNLINQLALALGVSKNVVKTPEQLQQQQMAQDAEQLMNMVKMQGGGNV